jgi:prepilin-type N-terminal cleavage/methylation domain-containing protein
MRMDGRIRRNSGGFTLLELMMVVLMIGVLCAIAGTAWMRYVKRSRTTEAVGHLQKMWTGAVSYYEADHALSNGTMADKQFPADPDCDSYVVAEDPCWENTTDQRCPGNHSVYTDVSRTDNLHWRSIQFNIADKHLYVPHIAACPDPKRNLWLEAEGNLDGDAIHSTFTRKANVGPSGDVEGYLTPAVVNETE